MTTPALITNEIFTYIYQLQNFIMWHYMYGSKYDTSFWKTAGKLKFEDPVFDLALAYVKQHSAVDLLDAAHGEKKYGQWYLWNFKYWYDGVKGK